MRKWLSYRKNHTIVRVAKSKKKGAAVEKCNVFFFDFPRKNNQKIELKSEKNRDPPKNGREDAPGENFSRKKSEFG